MNLDTKVLLVIVFLATVWPSFWFYVGRSTAPKPSLQSRYEIRDVAGVPMRIDKEAGTAQLLQIQQPVQPQIHFEAEPTATSTPSP